VTLGRLVLAWMPVAVVFIVVGGVAIPLRNADSTRPGRVWVFTKSDVVWRALEAMLATLFGSLWFDSLGSGEWWLVFLLVGLMVSFARVQGPAPPQRRETIVRTARDVLRYVLAGAVLAWRLG